MNITSATSRHVKGQLLHRLAGAAPAKPKKPA